MNIGRLIVFFALLRLVSQAVTVSANELTRQRPTPNPARGISAAAATAVTTCESPTSRLLEASARLAEIQQELHTAEYQYSLINYDETMQVENPYSYNPPQRSADMTKFSEMAKNGTLHDEIKSLRAQKVALVTEVQELTRAHNATLGDRRSDRQKKTAARAKIDERIRKLTAIMEADLKALEARATSLQNELDSVRKSPGCITVSAPNDLAKRASGALEYARELAQQNLTELNSLMEARNSLDVLMELEDADKNGMPDLSKYADGVEEERLCRANLKPSWGWIRAAGRAAGKAIGVVGVVTDPGGAARDTAVAMSYSAFLARLGQISAGAAVGAVMIVGFPTELCASDDKLPSQELDIKKSDCKTIVDHAISKAEEVQAAVDAKGMGDCASLTEKTQQLEGYRKAYSSCIENLLEMAENQSQIGMSPPEVNDMVEIDNNIAATIKTANDRIDSECRNPKPICRPYIGDPNDPDFKPFCAP